MTTVYVATLSTAHFDFYAVGTSEAAARDAMRATWDEHARQYDLPKDSADEFMGDVNVHPVTLDGLGVRF